MGSVTVESMAELAANIDGMKPLNIHRVSPAINYGAMENYLNGMPNAIYTEINFRKASYMHSFDLYDKYGHLKYRCATKVGNDIYVSPLMYYLLKQAKSDERFTEVASSIIITLEMDPIKWDATLKFENK